MDACDLLLGRLWQYDRCVQYDGYANRYSFIKDGVKVKLAQLPPSELSHVEKKTPPLVSLVTKNKVNVSRDEANHLSFMLVIELNKGTNLTPKIFQLLQNSQMLSAYA
jgi:hypothetical protein